ncbi:MAG: HEAT repeat domain-containing protein [Gammaproteobacteria bacterium]
MRVALYAVLTAKVPPVKPLYRALSDGIPPKLATSFEWIGRYGQIDLIVPLLQHENSQVRWAVAYALSKTGDARHLAVLAAAISDPVRMVSYRAKVAVDTIRKTEHRSNDQYLALEPISETECAIAKLILGQTQELDVPSTFRFLEHPDGSIRRLALHALAGIGKPAAEYIFAALARTEEPATPELVELLGELRDPRGVDYIAKYFAGSKRLEAITALAQIASDQAIRVLVRCLADDEAIPARYLEDALKPIGEPAIGPVLRAFVEVPRVRRRHGELVARLAGQRALDFLLEALQDRYRAVRESAERGLVALGESAVEPLIKLLVSSDSNVRQHAVRILGRIGNLKALDPVATIARQGTLTERWIAIEALGAFPDDLSFEILSDSLDSADRETRKRAAKALGPLGDTRAVFPLTQALTDADPSVRLETIRSLEKIAWRSKTHGEAVATALIQSLSGVDTEVVTKAFDALVGIGAPALGPIKRALEKAEDDLKRSLERARDRIEEQERLLLHSTFSFSCSFRAGMEEELLGTTEIPRPITDDVHFSVIAPRVLVPGLAFILDIWAHLDYQRELVIKRAREAQCGRDVRMRSKGPVQVERGVTMQVSLRIPDFGIEDMQDTIYWNGQVGNGTFPVTVPQDASVGYHFGMVCIFAGGLQIARLCFDLEVGSEVDEADDITSGEARIKSAFASYASEDRNEVLARIQGMLKLLPELLDVASLRSGDDWEDRIMKAIVKRDIFYLFWSLAASRSRWVEKEWRMALATRGLEFIDPVPLDPPSKVPPPTELARLHFGEWTQAYRTA